jgi:hypothetical protein
MRPTGLESIRAIQAALADIIAPELTSAFAQDAAGTLQMLLESLAGDWDTAAEDLRCDNEALSVLLAASRDALDSALPGNKSLASTVTDIENRLREIQDDSLTLSSLASRNHALRALLERILVAFEDLTGQSEYEKIDGMRQDIYAHLRKVATRGWSFWDISSFRERMVAVRSAAVEDDAREGAKVE